MELFNLNKFNEHILLSFKGSTKIKPRQDKLSISCSYITKISEYNAAFSTNFEINLQVANWSIILICPLKIVLL